jgi:hypothetical protein
MRMSFRSQKFLVWWAIVFAAIYGLALGLLLHMIPPPSAKLSAAQVAHWYSIHHTSIRIGAVIASWTSAFMVPWAIVIAEQMRREEKFGRVWTWCTLIGGGMMSIFLVLPPLFWGVAAFTQHRVDPQVTTIMHELGTLTLTTTDQYYEFMWVAIIVICFIPKVVKHSPFPRWFGYFTAWTGFMFEAGAFAFMPRGGPFAWNGLLVFWSPLTLFGAWLAVTSYLLLHNINLQEKEALEGAQVAVLA